MILYQGKINYLLHRYKISIMPLQTVIQLLAYFKISIISGSGLKYLQMIDKIFYI